MKEIKGFQGHIILYCKLHYTVQNVSFLQGIRRIWALRCGLDQEHTEKGQADRYIANELYSLIQIMIPEKLTYFHEIMHQELENDFKFEGLNALERLILIYRSEIMSIQIKEKLGEDYVSIIQLPEPNQPLFEKIIAGRAEYLDYKLVEN